MDLQYTIPKSMPSEDILESDYVWAAHKMSKLPEFNFRILLHKGWKAANYGLDEDPELHKLKYLAFISSGDGQGKYGMFESHAGVSILVTVIPEEPHSPIDWLDNYVANNARHKNFELLDANIYQHKENEAESFKDQLFRYEAGGQSYIRRALAYQTGRVYIIFDGAIKEEHYQEMADPVHVAFHSISFKLD